MTRPRASARLHQLDALRVIAFGLLIFYHSGMLYVSWGFHVKSPRLVPAIEWGMVLLNPWRLALLMFISGVASRFLLDKLGPRAFTSNRLQRLVPPLIFGLLIVVPPQTYFQVVQAGTWNGSYLSFWTAHYLTGDHRFGTPMPTWNHLWFLPYLLTYALGLALLAPVLRRRPVAPRVAPAGWLLVAPALWLAATNVLASEVFPDTHDFVGDIAGHARWVGLFGFGVAAARSTDFWEVLRARRRRWTTLALGLACAFLAVRLAIHAGLIGEDWDGPLYETASGLFGWSAILALLAQATQHLHRDSIRLRYLNGAVLPVYVLHQTVLICLAMWLFPLRLPLALEATLIVAGTFVVCFAAYELLIRRWRPLGWLFGSATKSRPTDREVGEKLSERLQS